MLFSQHGRLDSGFWILAPPLLEVVSGSVIGLVSSTLSLRKNMHPSPAHLILLVSRLSNKELATQ